jgi:hypothetical protein
MSGKAVIETDKLMKDEFSIIVQPDFTEMDVLFELYLTLENPENKGLFLIKRSYVVLPIAKQEGADLIQEQVLKPSLLPH